MRDNNVYVKSWGGFRTRARRRQPVLLSYRDEQDEEIHGVALIQDWYASQGIEYLVLGDGSVIRMDQLMSLNGKPVDACPSPSN